VTNTKKWEAERRKKRKMGDRKKNERKRPNK
jgi:hypothetical protein